MEFNSDFRYDLKVGQGAENQLAKVLQDERLEVKMDKRAPYTGLFFIEFSSRGKPSGLSVTEAEYWALVPEGQCCILVRTEKLKKLARVEFNADRIIKGGDNNTSLGVLIKLEDLHKCQTA